MRSAEDIANTIAAAMKAIAPPQQRQASNFELEEEVARLNNELVELRSRVEKLESKLWQER